MADQQTPRTVLVCGSRAWKDIHAIRMQLVNLPPTVVILHGAAPGADTIAGFLAQDFGFAVRAFPADWEKHGKRAGILRNLEMLDEQPDLVLAFGRGRGTDHTVSEAKRRGIPVREVGRG
jgi:hypothetical protein